MATQLTVTVGTRSSSSSKGGQGVGGGQAESKEGAATAGKIVQDGECVIALPAGVFAKGAKLKSSTKLSRVMGLLSVMVTAENQ
jgi:hypothetical protein